MANYKRELKMGADIRREGMVEKATEFAERIKRIQKKAEVALKRVQEEMKMQTDVRCGLHLVI